MKSTAFLIIAFLVSLPAFAQQPYVDPNKPDKELTEEEANIRLAEWEAKINNLEARLNELQNNVQNGEEQIAQMKADAQKCRDEIYRLIGATEADVQRFREKLGRIESRVRELNRMSDEQLMAYKDEIDQLERDLNALRREKIAILPEFYNRVIDIAGQIKRLRERMKSSTSTYTVGTWAKDRDCLWNIAAKDQIYNDPFLWPKIWQANTDQIRNPDLIRPGQVLQIPVKAPKSDEELRAERLYYRKKRAAARAAAARRAEQVDQQEAGSGGQ